MLGLELENSFIERLIYFIQAMYFVVSCSDFFQNFAQIDIFENLKVFHFAFELVNSLWLALFKLFESNLLVVYVFKLWVKLFYQTFVVGEILLGQCEFLSCNLLALFRLRQWVPEPLVLSKLYFLLCQFALVLFIGNSSLHHVKNLLLPNGVG